MTRARQAALLVPPSLRAIAWTPLLPAGLVGVGVVSLDGPPSVELRLAGAVLCVGAAFVLDDAAAETTASSPTSLLQRRLLRIALVLPVVVALWALVLAFAGTGSVGALTLELGAMLAAALAAAAVAAGVVPDRRGGLAAAPALLVLLAVAALLPDRWALFAPGPDDPRWAAAHGRWAAALVLALAVLLYASRDPARPRRRRRRLAGPRQGIGLVDSDAA